MILLVSDTLLTSSWLPWLPGASLQDASPAYYKSSPCCLKRNQNYMPIGRHSRRTERDQQTVAIDCGTLPVIRLYLQSCTPRQVLQCQEVKNSRRCRTTICHVLLPLITSPPPPYEFITVTGNMQEKPTTAAMVYQKKGNILSSIRPFIRLLNFSVLEQDDRCC